MSVTPGFEFPPDAQDAIEQQLRAQVEARQPLRSVRPDRQKPQMVLPTTQPVVVQQVVQPAPANVPDPTPVSDPIGISVDLPSRFAYYSFKDLYVRPFRVAHLAKVAKAHETSSMQSMGEVVSSVLMTPNGDTDIAFSLTMADFNAVLYWLRLNSFTKKQLRITSTCNDPTHNEQVKLGHKTQESLKITTLYTESSMVVNHLNEVPDPEVYAVTVEGCGRVPLRPETLRDVVQFLDLPNWEDEEVQYLARIASVIGLPLSLKEKMEIVQNGSIENDDALLALEFAEKVDSYGIEETVTTKCMGCGASGAVKIAVDALSFLSPEF